VCPECGEDAVRYSGFGTQKIEEELANLLPTARIVRMDTDSTAGRNSHEKLLESFSKGEYDIMIGTQMVAKGLNFPNVTLVGVVSVDQQLYNDDFRSLERTFSLLTQVVGRSGRGELKGTAVIQTLTPENEMQKGSLTRLLDYTELLEFVFDIAEKKPGGFDESTKEELIEKLRFTVYGLDEKYPLTFDATPLFEHIRAFIRGYKD
jgi:primosomal protein N' (replication factor Y)